MFTIGQMLDNCVANAAKRFSEEYPHETSDIEIHSWPQIWGNTSLGFSDAGGQMITGAQTFVLISNLIGAACVYHGGKFAYYIWKPSEEFNVAFKKRYFPGQAGSWRRLAQASG